jgi:hypothetical protein
MTEPAYLVALGILTLLLGVYLLAKARRRGEDLRRQAALLGLAFEYSRDLRRQPFSHLRLFKRGRPRKLHNVLSQSLAEGREKLLFDFSHESGSGKSSSLNSQTVLVERIPGLYLPAFQLSPEGLAHKLVSLFGYQDIDFPEDPEFSARYLLRGQDEELIRRLFSTLVRSWLKERKGWSIEGHGEWVAVFRNNKRVEPHELINFLAEASQIVESMTTGMVRS